MSGLVFPPEPPVRVERFYTELDHANRALGKNEGLETLLPNYTRLFVFFQRREALCSSQLDGVHSSLWALLLEEQRSGEGPTDSDAIMRYIAAVDHGCARLKVGFPLSNRLLRKVHSILQPSESAHPSVETTTAMADLERFLHRDQPLLPVLIEAALTHAQLASFEPFPKANRRMACLLTTLLLQERGALSSPSLPLSLYFKQHRERYDELLQRVRTAAEWEPWIRFFLTGITESTERTCGLAKAVHELLENDRRAVREIPSSSAPLRVLTAMEELPLATPGALGERTGLAAGTVATALSKLLNLGIVRETTGRKRDRIFEYTRYLRLLAEGTELMSRSSESSITDTSG